MARRARIAYLERVATVNLHKLGTALRLLQPWATAHGLTAAVMPPVPCR